MPRGAEQGMINRFRCAAFGSSLHMLRVWSARAVGGLRSGQVLIGRPFLRQGLPNGHALMPKAPRWPPPVLTTPSTLRSPPDSAPLSHTLPTTAHRHIHLRHFLGDEKTLEERGAAVAKKWASHVFSRTAARLPNIPLGRKRFFRGESSAHRGVL